MILRFTIRGNGFIAFCQFIRHFLETLLPTETFRGRIVVNIDTWYQDNSYTSGVFTILNMKCDVGNRRTIYHYNNHQYEINTIDI